GREKIFENGAVVQRSDPRQLLGVQLGDEPPGRDAGSLRRRDFMPDRFSRYRRGRFIPLIIQTADLRLADQRQRNLAFQTDSSQQAEIESDVQALRFSRWLGVGDSRTDAELRRSLSNRCQIETLQQF